VSRIQIDSVQPVLVGIDQDINVTFNLQANPSESVYRQLELAMSKEQQERLHLRTTAARALLDQIIHIPSLRPKIETTYTARKSGSQTVDEVPYLLSNQRSLLGIVDDWFKTSFDGVSISVDQAAFAFQLAELRSGLPVNLAESGRGLQSALPVVALLLALSGSKQKARLVVLEEPEAHLHPSVHGAMADLVIRCARRSQVIVETHSENFILRLRRRIAEAHLKHADVGLYYLDEVRNVIPVRLDHSGTTDNWPSGVFESDIEEARAIVEAKVSAMHSMGDAT